MILYNYDMLLFFIVAVTRPETLDLDSNNLYKLMEEHDPEALQRMVEVADTLQGEQGGSNFLDVANSVSNQLIF